MANIASCILKVRPMSVELGRDIAARIAALTGVSPREVGPFVEDGGGGHFVFFGKWTCDSAWGLLEELLQDEDYPLREELRACEIDGRGTEAASRYREAVKKFPGRSRLLRKSR